ncbi:hypothetical protein DFH09DRAFT_1074758 [Mycena vulgaris]|nr:hypothetical protein DFH09DRAFT_1074758 [Mycena vulgaris]
MLQKARSHGSATGIGLILSNSCGLGPLVKRRNPGLIRKYSSADCLSAAKRRVEAGKCQSVKYSWAFKQDMNNAACAILTNNIMISGPMNLPADKSYTPFFRQYAVIDQPTTDEKLKLQARHQKILCGRVELGSQLTETIYAEGQAGKPGFEAQLRMMQSRNA